MGVEGVMSGLMFGLICALFFGAGAFIFLQTIDKGLSLGQACGIYAPLFFCWLGIALTIKSPFHFVTWGLGICAIAWCILVPLKVITDNNKLARDLRDARIQESLTWLAAHPGDIPIRFKLAEAYENNGRLREAYEEYATCLTINPRENRARLRARELYEQITGTPMPAVAPAIAPSAGLPVAGVPVPGDATVITGGGLAPPPPDPGPPVFGAAPTNDPPSVIQLKSAIEEEPSDASRYAALGAELLLHGRTDEAVEAYRRAVWLDSSNDQYRSNLYALIDTSANPPPGYPTIPPAADHVSPPPVDHTERAPTLPGGLPPPPPAV